MKINCLTQGSGLSADVVASSGLVADVGAVRTVPLYKKCGRGLPRMYFRN